MIDHLFEVPKKVLSPAAQKVFDAFSNASDGEYIDGVWVVNERTMLSAALCAVAECAPTPHQHEEDAYHSGFYAAINYVRTIAAELEGK